MIATPLKHCWWMIIILIDFDGFVLLPPEADWRWKMTSFLDQPFPRKSSVCHPKRRFVDTSSKWR
jgi:hypothetical protein